MAMDELEISKIVGAGCAALLAFVGFGQLGSAMVGVDQLDEPAYIVEVADAGGTEEVAAMPIGQVMAMADVADGPKVFRKCVACHKVEDGANAVGPHLYNVVGRDIGGIDGYAYSGALMEKDGPWDFAALDGFLESPKKWAPGTKMGFAGLSKPEDRASVIAWLNEQGDNPLPMPPVEATEAEPAEAEEVMTAEVVQGATEADMAAVDGPADEIVVGDQPAAVEAEPGEMAAVEVEEEPVEAETETASVEMMAPAVAVASAPAFMAGADAAKGAKTFRRCKACHKVEAGAGNNVGPNLHSVIGRDIAALDGFKYSDALREKGGQWDFEALDGYLTKPKDWAPGTKMAFPGLRKESDRANVIAYLNENSDDPVALPE